MICKDRVVVVTGAGRGLGRAHALEFARQGAKVVVNDIGASLDGTGGSDGPAGEVVDMIRADGGEAIADNADVADWAQTKTLVERTIETFGGIDVIVNNAGFLRDGMFFKLTEQDWDDVIRVHMKGHFCLSRHAAEWWRSESKAGRQPDARIINTSSGAGILGSVAQSNYSAAKGGIATLTAVQAVELGRYGVTANVIAPAARTRMTEVVFAETMAEPEEGEWDSMAPENVSPLVAWLGSSESAWVNGRMFEVEAGIISVADGWQHGPKIDKGERWNPSDIGPAVKDLIEQAPAPAPVYGA